MKIREQGEGTRKLEIKSKKKGTGAGSWEAWIIRQGAGNREQRSGCRELGMESREQGPENQKQESGRKEQGAKNCKLGAGSRT